MAISVIELRFKGQLVIKHIVFIASALLVALSSSAQHAGVHLATQVLILPDVPLTMGVGVSLDFGNASTAFLFLNYRHTRSKDNLSGDGNDEFYKTYKTNGFEVAYLLKISNRQRFEVLCGGALGLAAAKYSERGVDFHWNRSTRQRYATIGPGVVCALLRLG